MPIDVSMNDIHVSRASLDCAEKRRVWPSGSSCERVVGERENRR
jgi:hypothetical protein